MQDGVPRPISTFTACPGRDRIQPLFCRHIRNPTRLSLQVEVLNLAISPERPEGAPEASKERFRMPIPDVGYQGHSKTIDQTRGQTIEVHAALPSTKKTKFLQNKLQAKELEIADLEKLVFLPPLSPSLPVFRCFCCLSWSCRSTLFGSLHSRLLAKAPIIPQPSGQEPQRPVHFDCAQEQNQS